MIRKTGMSGATSVLKTVGLTILPATSNLGSVPEESRLRASMVPCHPKPTDRPPVDQPRAIPSDTAIRAPEHVAFLGLGANVGRRREALEEALRTLHDHPQCRFDSEHDVASLYETTPLGVTERQPDYLNTVVRVKTELSPLSLLETVLLIEESLGRVRTGRWQAREMDIDILLFGNLIIRDPRLTLPHPRLHQRRFVLEPLAEIAEHITHPVLAVTIGTMARQLRNGPSAQQVRRIANSPWFFDRVQKPPSEPRP